MIFLSTLLRQNVYDNDNRRVGALSDICVALHETFPVVTALVVQPALGGSSTIVPWSQVQNIEGASVQLAVNQQGIEPYTPQPDELLLKRDILDKQIVDTQGFRVVKVNDLKLAQIKKTARLVGVDIRLSGVLRRLGILNPVERLTNGLPMRLS